MQTTIETPTQPHSPNGQPGDSSTVANKLERTDEVLQLSRRVDWRFLLPSPLQGKVAFIGPEKGVHFRALQRFCASLVHVDGISAPSADFDLVVIHAGQIGNLDLANNLLKRGGYVYWEIDRKALFKRGKRAEAFCHYKYFVKTAMKMGFNEIEVFWYRPKFNSCLEIIPLDNNASLASAFSKRGGSFRKQLKFLAGKFLWKSGLLSRIAPCISIMARKA